MIERSAPGARYDAVTFDFWNTLVWEQAGHLRGIRAEAWAGLLEEAGFAAERTLLDAVFDRSWERYVTHWTSNQQYQSVRAAEEILEQLGFPLPLHVKQALIEAYTGAGRHAELHLTEGIETCLRALKDAGLKLGIICDVGMTPSDQLREHLEHQGLLGLFDHWSFSDEVGHYKPSPIIFEHALTGLGGIDPTRAAHVGDIRRTDIAGARGMGMTAVRYTGISDDTSQLEPEGHHVVAHYAELPALLLA